MGLVGDGRTKASREKSGQLELCILGMMQLLSFLLVLSFLSGISCAAPYEDVVVGVPRVVEPLSTLPVRLRIPGLSRLHDFFKFAYTFHVTVAHTVPTKAKLEVCFHGNGSQPLSPCAKETWSLVDKKDGWSDVMSPFDTAFLDIKASADGSSANVTVTEGPKAYRYACLALGMTLVVIAPLVSSWVPFYYSSGITLGILLVVLVILFQLMKLLPTSRRSTLYVAVYGTVAGLGTVIASYAYQWAAAVLYQLGYGDDLVHPLVYLMGSLVCISGAALGYFSVRKYALSASGDVDEGTAKFVKWALRVLGAVSIAQSSQDPVISVLLVLFGLLITLGADFLPSLLSNLVESLSTMQLPPWPESLIPRDVPYLTPAKQTSTVKHSPVKILKDLPVNQGLKRPGTSPLTPEPRNRSVHPRHQPPIAEPRLGKFPAPEEAPRPLRPSSFPQKSTVSPLKSSPLTPLFRNSSHSPFGARSSSSPPFSSPSSAPARPAAGGDVAPEPGFYSTFHKMDHRPISKAEYKDMSETYTRKAVGDLLASEEFKDWALKHADRLGVLPSEPRQERSEADIQRTAHMDDGATNSVTSLFKNLFRR